MNIKLGSTRERSAYVNALRRVNTAETLQEFCDALSEFMNTPQYAVYSTSRSNANEFLWRRISESKRTILDFKGDYIAGFMLKNGRSHVKIVWKEVIPHEKVRDSLAAEFAKCSHDGSIWQMPCAVPLYMLEAADAEGTNVLRFILGG